MKQFCKIIFFLLPFFIFSPITIHAQNSEAITNYLVGINATSDATVNIVEEITYDFGTNSRHGICRDIPYIIVNQDNKRYKLTLENFKVTDKNNLAYKFTKSTIGDNIQLKIGDADKYVTGQKIYKISYDVKGGLRYFSDHDEVYWNAVGTKWKIPIDKVLVHVVLPQNTKINNIACFKGAQGSTDQNCKTTQSINTVTLGAENLNSYQGFTVAISIPKGIFAVVKPKEDKPGILSRIMSLLLILAVLFWYLIAPFAIIVNWFRTGRDPAANPNIPVWYDPPKNKEGEKIKPAEVGTLVDESADNRDISATIIDLAIRGFLKIREDKKGEYTLIKVKELENDTILADFEKDILKGIFKEKTEITTKKLADSFYQTASKVKNDLYDRVVKDGFFDKNPQSTRTKYYVIAGLALFTGNFFLALVAFLFGKNMPKKTVLGVQANVVSLGMKKFLTSQERQLEFQAKNWMFFEKLLPFAIVFGVEKIWAQRFKDIAMEPPAWYEGTNWQTFNTLYFVDSLTRSTSAFASMSMSPTRSSSGFSSVF